MTESDAIDGDVLIVGAGPAGLAAAYHLQRITADRGDGLTVAVLEKGKEVGAHSISGAVMDPRALSELIPDWRERGAPVDCEVRQERLDFLTERRHVGFPVIPPPLRNDGNVVLSLNRLTRWLGTIVEESGVDVFAGFSGSELLIEGGSLVGVRTGAKGVGRDGAPKSNFEPGIDIRAKVTLLAEGSRGSLTKRLVAKFRLDTASNPQVYSVGIKEVWEVPHSEELAGRVIHTMGYPLSAEEFGGGFLYNMTDGLVSVGLVVGLDYRNPRLDPHERFQRFKQHPWISSMLEGGQIRSYGAKTIPEGGYWALPQYYFNGGLILGDGAGFLNSMRLKGIHMALKSGMLAAEAALDAIEAGDCSASALQGYERLVEESWLYPELWRVRNFHQGFDKGLWAGMAHAGLQLLTGGRGLRNRYRSQAGHKRMRMIESSDPAPASKLDHPLAFDKLTDVYHSGTAHEEDQPVHLVVTEPDICTQRCTREFGNPCQYFCPAAVYAIESDADGKPRLDISASNCVHCKACDIMDPYQIIDWVCPEGGGGPGYEYL